MSKQQSDITSSMTKRKTKRNQYPKTTITLDGMTTYELCRWASLKDAVDIVAEKCEEKKIDFNDFDLKPLDLLKYVDCMTDQLYNKVTEQESNA
jgi:hypothetical protein